MGIADWTAKIIEGIYLGASKVAQLVRAKRKQPAIAETRAGMADDFEQRRKDLAALDRRDAPH